MSELSFQSLQNRLSEETPVLTGLLDEYYLSSEHPLVDQNFDNSTDKSFAYIKSLNRAFELDGSNEAFEVMYRSFHFAVHVAGLSGWDYREEQGMYDYYLSVLHECGEDTEAIQQRIFVDTDAYAQKNKLLCQLIQAYSAELTPREELLPLSRTVAALTFMQIDQDIIYRNAQTEAVRFGQELSAWDGTIEGMA